MYTQSYAKKICLTQAGTEAVVSNHCGILGRSLLSRILRCTLKDVDPCITCDGFSREVHLQGEDGSHASIPMYQTGFVSKHVSFELLKNTPMLRGVPFDVHGGGKVFFFVLHF